MMFAVLAKAGTHKDREHVYEGLVRESHTRARERRDDFIGARHTHRMHFVRCMNAPRDAKVLCERITEKRDRQQFF